MLPGSGHGQQGQGQEHEHEHELELETVAQDAEGKEEAFAGEAAQMEERKKAAERARPAHEVAGGRPAAATGGTAPLGEGMPPVGGGWGENGAAAAATVATTTAPAPPLRVAPGCEAACPEGSEPEMLAPCDPGAVGECLCPTSSDQYCAWTCGAAASAAGEKAQHGWVLICGLVDAEPASSSALPADPTASAVPPVPPPHTHAPGDLTYAEVASRLHPGALRSHGVLPASDAPRQLAHLHHMKTGGTSINDLLQCALKRGRAAAGAPSLPFASLEECSRSRYASCVDVTDDKGTECREKLEGATVAQFCSPLRPVEQFGWLDVADVITVLRHPVDRVWSMYRFRTKGCYRCTPLLDLYEAMDAGTLVDGTIEDGCLSQLVNHQTRNMLLSDDLWSEAEGGILPGYADGDDEVGEELVAEAVRNLRDHVTLVGLSDELPAFADMLGRVFPWLAEEVGGGGTGAGAGAAGMTCALPHSNSSPRNNHCGRGGGHLDLPERPDAATAEAILRHNLLDLELYEAAQRRFQVQRQVLAER